MNELTTIKTTNIIDAKKETDNATYNISYQYNEFDNLKTLSTIHIEVLTRSLEGIDTFLITIGSIDYRDNKISMPEFPLTEKTVTYIQEATDIIEEIKSLMI